MEARDLYGLPLDRFVPERDALVKKLRKEGRREEAAALAALRRPSVAAWAVNQLVRTQSRAVASLFEAGDALQRAHEQLLSGRGDGGGLRAALAREREAVDELAEKARGLLSSEGHALAQATLERVSETLHAAALDPEARAQVEDGCLHRELRHVGLGAAGAPATPRKATAREASTSGGGAGDAGRPAAARKAEAQASRAAARAAEAHARRAAERAGRELEAAERRRDRAAESLREAEAAVAAARERADRASSAHRRAEQELAGH